MRFLTSSGRVCLLASSLYCQLVGAATAVDPEVVELAAATPATPAAAAFATTKTRVWSTTSSSVSVVLWINSRKVTSYTTATMTAYEPGPVTGPFPATVTRTVVSHVTQEDRTTYLDAAAANSDRIQPTTSRTEWVYTTGEVWIVSPARPTDLVVAAGAKPGCAEGTGTGTGTECAEVQPEGTCEAAGLRTGCAGQCELRGEQWWCYRMWQREYGRPGIAGMSGRACWGGDLRFEQLNVPCVEGDVDVGCVRCRGVDQSWGAVYWTGPG
ncbi:hypothetical protein QBC47DRAFT_51271 [Echria macrotheca]|uniref:Uncharacterized protein n=1 Tax=Echria macrotheca TaxID=438768 RepID=A0AAJ0B9R0_9PEZI|nr:hypothetical protein QBC47DRAFT_51271 [Echria macrotheca]